MKFSAFAALLALLLLALIKLSFQQSDGMCYQTVAVTSTRRLMRKIYYLTKLMFRCEYNHLEVCMGYGSKFRERPFYVTTTTYEQRAYCCNGYIGEPPMCRAFCPQRCYNGGTCTTPNNCTCQSGWIGDNCIIDVNECENEPTPCGENKACFNIEGSYLCECDIGYEDDDDNCKDINECDNNSHECSQVCENTQGGYICKCMDGYYVALDGRQCEDVNECLENNAGCAQNCINTNGSYTCTCNSGFNLSPDMHNCTDIRECSDGTHNCQQICNELEGGFICDCFKGYELENDNVSCRDINECKLGISRCQQQCINTEGSYFCDCRSGFQLDTNDNYTCIDINECDQDNGGCEQNCNNTFGSYKCSCKDGYTLEFDGVNCTGQPCISLMNPRDGSYNCSGPPVTGAVCSLDCNPGYRVTGPMERECLHNNMWSGSTSFCELLHCDPLENPEHGSVILPCATRLGTKCKITCFPGYYINSTNSIQKCDLTASNFAEWTESPKCIEAQACNPNPCNHNGSCTIGDDSFVCNCEGTGYTGIDCNRLLIDVPEVPSLTVNSPMRLLLSAKPDENLVLNLIPDNKKYFHVEPLSVTFSKYNTSQHILMNSTKSGLYKLRFEVQNKENLDIEDIPPASILVIDDVDNESNYFIRQGVESGLLVSGCFLADDTVTHQLDIQCSSDLFFNSTRKWSTKGSVNSAGVIFSNNNGFIMPVAIAGAKLKKPQGGGPYIEIDSLNTFEFNFDCDRQTDGTCKDTCLSVNDIQSILHHESLGFTYFRQAMVLVPKWFRLKALPSNHVFYNENNYMVNLVYRLETTQDCSALTALTDGLHSMLIYSGSLEVQLNNETRKLESGTVPVCFATNLCEGSMSPLYISIPNEAQPIIESFQFMRNLRRKQWSVHFDSLVISDSTIEVKSNRNSSYWNGIQYFIPDPITPNMVATVKFTKSFNVNDICKVEWYFDGNVQLFHEDLNEIFTVESSLGWNGNISGSMIMNINVTLINGKASTMQLTNDTTSSLLLSGDANSSLRCHGCINPMGFALKLVYHTTNTSTGLFSTLLFVPPKEEFGLPTQFSCPLDSFMFLNSDHSLEAISMSSSCLDIYLGMFPIFDLETHVYIFDECKISDFCSSLSSRDAKILVWSVFPDTLSHINLGYFIKLLPVSNSNKTGLIATFAKDDHLFKAEILNIEVSLFDTIFQTSATIDEHHLEFTKEVNLFSKFPTKLSGQISQTSNWEGAPINIYGKFLSTFNNFPELLCKQVDKYIAILYSRSQTRVRNAEVVYNRAISQLAVAQLNLNNTEISKNKSLDLVKATEEEIDKIVRNISSLTNDLQNANDEVKSLTERIDELCTVQQCPEVCIPGQVCNECEQQIETVVQGICTVACTVNVTVTEMVGYNVTSRNEWVLFKTTPMFCYCSMFECTTSTPCIFIARCIPVVYRTPITKDRIISQPSVCNKPCSEVAVQAPVPTECCVNEKCPRQERDVECVQDNINCQATRKIVYDNLAQEQRSAIMLLQSLDEAKANERGKRIRLMRYKAHYNRAEKHFNESKIALNQARTALTIATNAFNKLKFENSLDLLEKIINTSTCASAASPYFRIHSVSFNTTVITESPTALPVDIVAFNLSKNETKSERVIVDFHLERFDMSLQQAAVVITDSVIFNQGPTKRSTRNIVNVSTTDENYLHFQSRCSDLENIVNYFNKLNASILTVAATVISSMANLSENMQDISNLIGNSSATFSKQRNIDFEMIGNITGKSLGDLFVSESNNTEEVDELLSLMQEYLSNSQELAKTLEGNMFQLWQTKMEDLHNQTKSAGGFSCFGFSDCLQKVLEELNELISDIPPQSAKVGMLLNLPVAANDLLDLALLQHYSIVLAIANTQKIYDIVNNPVLNDYWCAGPPIIVTQPMRRINPRENTTIELSCEVEEEKYTTYQWKKDCIQLPNQKNRTLVLTNVKLSDSGNYTCVVTNQASSVTSLNSSVEVQQPPSYFLQLENVDEYYGNWNGAIFKVNASAWPYPGFRWYFRPKGETEFTQIPDADENELAIVPPLPKDEGSYYCEAFNEQGALRSRIANLTVLDSSVVQVAQTVYLNFTSLNDMEESNTVDTIPILESNNQMGSGYDDNITFAKNIFKINVVGVLSTLVTLRSTYIENITVYQNSANNVAVSFTLYSQNISYPETPLTEINQLAPQARIEWLTVWENLQALVSGSELIVDDGKEEYKSDISSLQFGILQFTCPIGRDVSSINNFLCVNCPPGSYQIVVAERTVENGRISQFTTQKCVSCPVGYYQDEQGHAICKKCPEGHTTLTTGNRLKSDCIKLCSPGSFSLNRMEPCMACPSGMYSIGMGSTSCFNCNDEGKRKLCPFDDPCEKCQQLCHNNSTCACHEGYTLSVDGYSCIKCAEVFRRGRLAVVDPTWHVALCNTSEPSDPLVCGGSLINDQWVITSARCVCGHNIDLEMLSLRISKKRTCIVEEDNEINIFASEIYCHPGYNNSDDKLTDLALIKMSSPIQLSNALPLCIKADDTSEIYNNDQSSKYYTSGLGNPVITNAVLTPSFVSLRPNSACFEVFLEEEIDYKSNPNVFCTDSSSKSKCVGNPGSAVISYNDTSDKIIFIGVISRFTNMCGESQSFTANTKVQSSDVLQWIDNTIVENN